MRNPCIRSIVPLRTTGYTEYMTCLRPSVVETDLTFGPLSPACALLNNPEPLISADGNTCARNNVERVLTAI